MNKLNKLLREIEWKKHLIGMVCLGVALALLLVSTLHYFEEGARLQAQIDAYRQQQITNQTADESRQILDSNLADFRQLQGRGIVGSSRRLQWIEATQTLAAELRLPLIEYTLEGTVQAGEAANQYWSQQVSMSVTPMKLGLTLRHEGDFYRFMDRLATNAEGLFSIDSCRLELDRMTNLQAEKQPELTGECDLLWYNLDDVTTRWESASL